MTELTSAHNRLAEKSQVVERPFTSNVPLAGPFIARFREAWNSVSTRWYVRPLLAQQNAYNQMVAEQVRELHGRLQDLDGRLIVQDKEQTNLVHDTAELTTQLIQMNRRLEVIEQRLTRLETGEHSR
jgi:hypothetical protein